VKLLRRPRVKRKSPARRANFSYGASLESENEEDKDLQFLRKFHMHPDQLVADPDFNRWTMAPFCTAAHMCIGSIFAWSIFNQPLTTTLGVVCPAADDWIISDISPTFSLVMGGFAIGAFLGKYLNRWGPRCSLLIGSGCLGSGFGLVALGAHVHSLPVLYAGGMIWGFANGWTYVPPIATLMKWFPDRKGFASSCVVVGFGGGAAVAAPMFDNLLQKFKSPPTYLGTADQLELTNRGGKLFADTREVVVAVASEAKAAGLEPGVYLVGTGNTGVTSTLLVSGLVYSSILVVSALQLKTPIPSTDKTKDCTVSDFKVSASNSIRTPQFWLLFAGFGLGMGPTYGTLPYMKTMVGDCFGQTLPTVATAAACGTFVSAISIVNMGGRILWPNVSDFLVNRYKPSDPF